MGRGLLSSTSLSTGSVFETVEVVCVAADFVGGRAELAVVELGVGAFAFPCEDAAVTEGGFTEGTVLL